MTAAAFTRHRIIRSGYVKDVEPRDRIICTNCEEGVTVPRGQTIPLTHAHLGHRCGDPLWSIPPYIPARNGRPMRRREPVLTDAMRLDFQRAARTDDVTA